MADLSRAMRGRAWKLGDSVDTGQLASTGVRVSDDPKANLKANCLRGRRPEFNEQVQEGDIIVAGTNFGCGSSRAMGIWALQACGIQAVLAESVSRLCLRNGVAQGLLTFNAPGITTLVEDGDEVEIDYQGGAIRNLRTGRSLPLRKLPATVEAIYESGGIHQVIAKRLAAEGILPPAPVAAS